MVVGFLYLLHLAEGSRRLSVQFEQVGARADLSSCPCDSAAGLRWHSAVSGYLGLMWKLGQNQVSAQLRQSLSYKETPQNQEKTSIKSQLSHGRYFW